MSAKYDYEGLPFKKVIARSLISKLYPEKGYHSVQEIKDGVLQYHLEHGGAPPKIKSLYTIVYKILRKFEEEGKAKRKNGSKSLWKILSIANKDEVDIFHELRIRDERIERLETALVLVLTLTQNRYVGLSAEEYLSNIHDYHAERVEKLVTECGSANKTIEKLIAIVDKHLNSNDE